MPELPPNLRDLGGLPLVDGGSTPSGRIWRSGMERDAPPQVWDGIRGLGIRTVVDLRNPEERTGARAPDGIGVVPVPVERPDDPEYSTTWAARWAEPGFYVWGMHRWPELWDAAFRSIAGATAEPMLIHCAAGRDRTGFVVALLLHAAGVTREAVLDDYRRGVRASLHRDIDDLVDGYAAELDAILDRPLPERWRGPVAAAAVRLR